MHESGNKFDSHDTINSASLFHLDFMYSSQSLKHMPTHILPLLLHHNLPPKPLNEPLLSPHKPNHSLHKHLFFPSSIAHTPAASNFHIISPAKFLTPSNIASSSSIRAVAFGSALLLRAFWLSEREVRIAFSLNFMTAVIAAFCSVHR
jgi:hypothetical protein